MSYKFAPLYSPSRRFRSIPEIKNGLCVGWTKLLPAKDVKVEEHLVDHTFDSRALAMQFVDQMSTESMRLDRPLWEMHFLNIKDGTFVCALDIFFFLLDRRDFQYPRNCIPTRDSL